MISSDTIKRAAITSGSDSIVSISSVRFPAVGSGSGGMTLSIKALLINNTNYKLLLVKKLLSQDKTIK